MQMIRSNGDFKDFNKEGIADSNNVLLFANYVSFGGENQSIFEENTYTVTYIERSEPFEVIAIDRSIETIQDVDNARIDGKRIKMMSRTTMSVYAEKNLFKFFDDKTVLFTEGVPLNPYSFQNGTQEVYISKTAVPTEVNQLLQVEGMSDAAMSKLNELEESTNITSYQLINILSLNEVVNSTNIFSDDKMPDRITDIKIKYDKSFGLHRIYGKGTMDGDYQSLNFKIKNSNAKFALLKFSPISLQNKVIFKCDSLDRTLTLPYKFLSQFKTKKGLREFIYGNGEEHKKELWKLFLSLLTLTQAFANGFSEFQIKGSDGRSGINPNATIGGIKIGMLSGTNSNDALDAISGRIEDWKLKYPQRDNTREFKLFKIFVSMLTPYIQSDLSLGYGLNQMNKIDQLFHFDLITAISGGFRLTKKDLEPDNKAFGDGYEVGTASDENNDIIVQLKSEFFDIDETTGDLTIKDMYKELSVLQVLDLDGSVSFAELEEELEELNVPAKQGNKDINNNNLSKYYIYTPADTQSQMQSMYGKLNDKKTTVETPVVNSVFIYRLNETPIIDIITKALRQGNYKGLIKQKSTPPSYKQGGENEAEFYWRHIRPTLAPNQKVKEWKAGYPEINFTITFDETEWRHFSGGAVYFVDRYKVTFSYTVIETYEKQEDIFYQENKIYDKHRYLELVKENTASIGDIELELDYHYINPNNVLEELNQLVLSGIFGNKFSVEIKGYDDGDKTKTRTFTLEDLDFYGKHNPIHTKTKINF